MIAVKHPALAVGVRTGAYDNIERAKALGA